MTERAEANPNESRSGRFVKEHLLYLVPVIFSFLVLMYASTWPGLNWSVTFFFALAPLIISGVAFVAFVMTRLRSGGPLSWVALLVGPVLAIVAVTSLIADVGVRARFALSRADFEAQVEDLKPTGSGAAETIVPGPARIGSFEILEVRQAGDVIWFVNRGTFLANEAGFVFAPDGIGSIGRTSGYGPLRYTTLGDGWFAFTEPL